MKFKNFTNSACVILLSGGLDSTTLLYQAQKDFEKVQALSFFYGQKHKKELDCAKKTCQKLNIHHKIVDISYLKNLITQSSLTNNEIDIPEGHYEEKNMKSTVVPFRNMILFANALAYSADQKATHIGLATHLGDHAIYPDCRPKFWEVMKKAAKLGDWQKIEVYNPFQLLNKANILKIGLELNVDYSLTWTCYKGLNKACGHCGACTERLEAFALNKIKDPITYQN